MAFAFCWLKLRGLIGFGGNSWGLPNFNPTEQTPKPVALKGK